ncbi:MAG: Rho termination factor N-terminal domain-containing protein, partial [Burkholderiales bacterium]|nr:Rho termination factor N-terminal domain-containing protein [Burkholderiales bacterium]
MHLREIKDLHVAELLDIAASLNIEGASRLRKHDIIFSILRRRAESGENIY